MVGVSLAAGRKSPGEFAGATYDGQRLGFVPFKAYITIAIRLRYDYDEKLTFIFLLSSNGSRRARYVVVGS